MVNTRYRIAVLLMMAFLLPGCEDAAGPDNECDTEELPLSAAANAPTVIDVALEVQPSGIVALATATDPQGTANLLTIEQSIAVFTSTTCTGAPIVLTDDLAGSGLEESFGTVVASDTPLYDSINAASAWPVELVFRDADGNRTDGRVLARVIH